ncbi:hypothetical protein RAS2_02800 [Phycisphaerae bacterium RAS2]|nr:hypothetical protein RAS2_02800 [Phycisphaerae bacterium RAS2]
MGRRAIRRSMLHEIDDLKYCCDEMKYHLSEREVAIVYIKSYDEYAIRVPDGSATVETIEFCPWCGAKLSATHGNA